MGMEERFQILCIQSFLPCRLSVDTFVETGVISTTSACFSIQYLLRFNKGQRLSPMPFY